MVCKDFDKSKYSKDFESYADSIYLEYIIYGDI